MDSEAEFRYSLLPSVKSGKYRETEGIKDVTEMDSSLPPRLIVYGNDGQYVTTYYEDRNLAGPNGAIYQFRTGLMSAKTETKTFLVQQQTVSAASALGLDDDEIVGNYTFLAEED